MMKLTMRTDVRKLKKTRQNLTMKMKIVQKLTTKRKYKTDYESSTSEEIGDKCKVYVLDK